MFPIHEIKFSRVLFEVTKCHTFFKKEMHLILLLNISPRMLFLIFHTHETSCFFFLLLWMNPKLCLLLRYFSSQSQFAPIEEKYTKQSAELRPSCIVFTVTSWLELPVSVMTFLLISQQLSIYTAYQLTSWFYFSLSHYHLMSQTNIYKISNCLTFIYIFYPIRSHPFKYF